jgi:ABC-type polysaccharide/polyol phosphate transport system ATPase subunit
VDLTENNAVISLRDVSKSFRVHTERNQTLKERVLYAGRSKFRDFTALRHVSLDVFRGESIGLIGVNGSGKSTLLKLMSQILYPDEGTVEVNGRVSSLLELGAGFHPDFSGRENVFMNGALLGLSRREIRAKLDEIIDFSELGDFIDEPVRSYSSGMYMRLAFSVAVAVDPEIILIDEILAVGDAAFQAKCMNRLRELRAKETTIIIVTHDTSAVERFCDRVIWMHDSKVRMQGTPIGCIQAYLATVFKASNEGANKMSFERSDETSQKASEKIEDTGFVDSSILNEVDAEGVLRWGSGEVKFTRVEVSSSGGDGLVQCGEPVEITMDFRVNTPVKDIDFGIGVFTSDDVRCYGTNTRLDRIGQLSLESGEGRITFDCSDFCLIPGTYWVDVACCAPDTQAYDYWRRALQIQVYSDINDVGLCRIPHKWKIEARQMSADFVRSASVRSS